MYVQPMNYSNLQIVEARLGGDDKARRHRQLHARHLAQVGSLVAEQVLVGDGALIEEVDSLLLRVSELEWSEWCGVDGGVELLVDDRWLMNSSELHKQPESS
jgi:hypothetical protein